MDALLCDRGDEWDVSESTREVVKSELDEGICLYITMLYYYVILY